MAQGEAPVLATLAEMNVAALSRVELDPAVTVAVRLSALIASGAPAASYLLHIAPALETGVTLEDLQDVMVSIAPIVGSARILTAAGHIAEALGVAIEVAENM